MGAGVHLRHGWFFAIFFFCTAIVLANAVHYVLFRVLRRKESGTTGWGWGWNVQRYLSHPARTIFLLTCLLVVLPTIPGLPKGAETTLRQVFIMLTVAALG